LEYPWQDGVLNVWDIVGMNHYHVQGQKHLFVAMTRFDHIRGKQLCIKAEGRDEQIVFRDLKLQAERIKQANLKRRKEED
jgi:hypothetical protein